MEFRVTAPIRPTNFQKTLYGDILTEHILVELVTIPWLDALSQKPGIVVVRDPLFLGGNDRQDIPIVVAEKLLGWSIEIRYFDAKGLHLSLGNIST